MYMESKEQVLEKALKNLCILVNTEYSNLEKPSKDLKEILEFSSDDCLSFLSGLTDQLNPGMKENKDYEINEQY